MRKWRRDAQADSGMYVSESGTTVSFDLQQQARKVIAACRGSQKVHIVTDERERERESEREREADRS
jgi:hypothetical protein